MKGALEKSNDSYQEDLPTRSANKICQPVLNDAQIFKVVLKT
jgi:hypothetical protein